jgi:hypothetical protein
MKDIVKIILREAAAVLANACLQHVTRGKRRPQSRRSRSRRRSSPDKKP